MIPSTAPDALKAIQDRYPGNAGPLEQLRERLKDGRAVAFVGEGVAWPLYPSCVEIIDRLAHEAERRGLVSATAEAFWRANAVEHPLPIIEQIRDKLGPSVFQACLFEQFHPRLGADGKPYTPAQAALARARFKGWLTSHFDPGLIEARLALSADRADDGFVVWNQSAAVDKWLARLADPTPGPAPATPPRVLFAHGYFADPDQMVFGGRGSRRSYRRGPYDRLLAQLWENEHLVFIGFDGRTDFLRRIVALKPGAAAAPAAGRRLALVGLPEQAGDGETIRSSLLKNFGVEAIFYPAPSRPDAPADHSRLAELLNALIPQTRPPEIERPPFADAGDAATAEAPPTLFVHACTDDRAFSGRRRVMARLDGWVREPTVKLIAVTGPEGAGKTSLIGRWMKRPEMAAAGFEGLFFWSFSRNRSAGAFFDSLLAFARERLGWAPDQPDAPALEQALELLRRHRLLVVLDGLGVIQASGGFAGYDRALPVELAELIHDHCRGDAAALILLSSRFPFTDLSHYLGDAIRLLALPALMPEESAELLSRLGVGGDAPAREHVGRELFGHPLALRIFARAVPEDARDEPRRCWDRIVGASYLTEEKSLEGWMHSLLTFMSRRLDEPRRRALGLLGLLRIPAAAGDIEALWKLAAAEAGADPTRTLRQLAEEGWVTIDTDADGSERFSCHSLIGRFFRSALLNRRGFAAGAVDELERRFESVTDHTLETVELAAVAIRLRLAAGDFKGADDLFAEAYEQGDVLISLPAPHVGMDVAGRFVGDTLRRQAVQEELGARTVSFYLTQIGMCAKIAGDTEAALKAYLETLAYDRQQQGEKIVSIDLQNIGETAITLGLLTDAREHLTESIELTRAIEDEEEERDNLALRGFAALLQGDLVQAEEDFNRANAIEHRLDPAQADLYGFRGVLWGQHLARTGRADRARELTEANHEICGFEDWVEDQAECDWLLAELDLQQNRPDETLRRLRKVEVIFTRSHMIFELARAMLTRSAALLATGEPAAAAGACERALRLAATRKFRLIHADALVQRSLVALQHGDKNGNLVHVRTDAEAALQLAESCGYAWGQLAATELLAGISGKEGDDAASARHRHRVDQWNEKFKPA